MLLKQIISNTFTWNFQELKIGQFTPSCLVFLFILINFISGVCQTNIFNSIQTDCARYFPGDTVHITIKFQVVPSGDSLRVSYRHLDQVIGEETITGIATQEILCDWLPPPSDYRGYLVEVDLIDNGTTSDHVTIAVDISSDWQKFPRYGFLSQYPYLNLIQIDEILDRLNRYHINGLQFYDWHYKHHKPLKGTPANPTPTWNDIANRINYFVTVQGYILGAHSRNIKAMAYNLLYGAWADAQTDGVSPEWRLFRDSKHLQPDFHDLPPTWASDIYLIDPTNQVWIDYIFSTTRDALTALPFDGWHIDQLGDRGTLYNYQGQIVNLENSFLPYIQQAKDSLEIDLVMNAVNQFGQGGISLAPVDFLYTEVWPPYTHFSDLASIISYNSFLSHDGLNSVLAAYINRGLSGTPGQFNTPAVLLADAVIFANGGAHLELGEHMLGNEYFPNNNLTMSSGLQTMLIHYYDFMVAYQNLLRNGAEQVISTLQTSAAYAFSTSAQQGKIWVIAKKARYHNIFNLINFSDATTMEWADNSGIQAASDTIFSLPLFFQTSEPVSHIWMASPDFNQCSPQEIEFTAQSDTVSFILPKLKYWTMIVAETDSAMQLHSGRSGQTVENFMLTGNYPNPFNPATRIQFYVPYRAKIKIDICNTLGQEIAIVENKFFNPGQHHVTWQPQGNIAAGIYISTLYADDHVADSQKLLYIK